MQAAVVFYSLDGNCEFVAKEIKTQLKADLIQLQTVDQKKRGFWGKMFWGGGMAVTGKKPPIKPVSFDPLSYNLIIVGVPVWAGHPAPPIKTFLSQIQFHERKVALFVCHGGGKKDALKELKALFAGNEIVGEIHFKNPLKKPEKTKQKVLDWVKNFGGWPV